MTDAAVAWAERATGRPVRELVPLTGGITSTMLRLRHATGDDTVLRLVTEEPWRAHGAELVRREAETQATLSGSSVPAPRSVALDERG